MTEQRKWVPFCNRKNSNDAEILPRDCARTSVETFTGKPFAMHISKSNDRRYRHSLPILAAASLVLLTVSSTAAAQQTINVPIRDERAISVEGTQLIAAMLSKDALVLVIYGDSNPSSSAMTAAGESIAAGYPLRGVIYGPTRHDARVVVEFYADSQLTATLLNADAQDKASIRTEIARGYDEVVGPRRRAAQR